jgi:predicted phosphodiesterase
MASTIKTRVLIISDTHNAPLSRRNGAEPTAPFKSPLPSADLLIHCGDLTMTGQLDEYHRTLDMLAEIDAPV